MSEEFRVFDAAEHPEQTNIYDRVGKKPDADRLYWPEDEFVQGADLNEAFSREAAKRTSIGNMIASEGNKISGAEVIVDSANASLTITDGEVYSQGAVRPVAGAIIENVPMVGAVTLGYTIAKVIVDADDDPDYLGLQEGTPGFEEKGAVRTFSTIQWVLNSEPIDGEFFPFVEIKNGEVVSQEAPPTLSGVQQQIGRFVTNSAGNFISNGCTVSALGKIGDDQHFSIEAGTAYVGGLFVNRNTGNRHIELEQPELARVDAEPQTYTDENGTAIIELNNHPIKAVEQVTVTKLRNVSITKGAVDGADDLPDDGVSAIVTVEQGGTTFIQGTDYRRDGDKVDWLSSGNQPSIGSTYNVSYHYLDAETPINITNNSVEVANGVDDAQMFVTYSYALPRHDSICLDSLGNIHYLKGISTSNSPLSPNTPDELLKIAEVQNDFSGTPLIVNNGTRNAPYDEIRRMFDLAINTRELALQNRGDNKIAMRAQGRPSGVFTDPLLDDSQRDAGEPQTAAVFGGSIQLAVVPDFIPIDMGRSEFLDYVEVPEISQELKTGCVKINPYMAFAPLPALMTISPNQDFWTMSQTNQLSEQTRVFGAGNTSRVVSSVVLQSSTSQLIENLRQINIIFRIEQYGPGETLDQLLFDGIDVTPSPVLVADANGIVTGSFTIPSGIVAGRKSVLAVGGSGTRCSAIFTGQGTLVITSLQRVTDVERFQVNPIPRENNVWQEGEDAGMTDPQAQSIVFSRSGHLSSVDIEICAIGNPNEPVLLEVVTTDNGFPTTEVLAQTEISMVGVVVGQRIKLDLGVPLYRPGNEMFWYVVKTNDPDHSIAIADRGGFDATRQEWVAAQPYTIGTRASSSNAISWTIHQDSDITFVANRAVYGPTTKRVELGTYPVTDVSDIIVGADVFLPNGSTEALFELTFGDEDPVNVRPNQPLERDSFFSGDLKVALILNGTADVSPIVRRDVVLMLGTLQTEGTYVGRAFPVGGNKTIDADGSVLLPNGATVKYEVDAADGNWIELDRISQTVIDRGYLAHEFEKTGVTLNPNGRLKITITGSPEARPAVSDVTAFAY